MTRYMTRNFCTRNPYCKGFCQCRQYPSQYQGLIKCDIARAIWHHHASSFNHDSKAKAKAKKNPLS
ncbi:hypothetical protein CY34DRAFT_458100 [Suillus luteus UH-Slu-Lm8-n1]|uniref:Uncharacterized protein n=1 Tax=Suillus luteus UH-Slu-Lm8-n1 TaxID=930992 RepID=A0A0D0A7P8_9AGAM|nr:hypothetical protein CY34DRAFT_458100 [Suillus luteus UH-Slu-Lm8-n1]